MLSIAVCDDEVIECCNIARKIKDILEEMKIPCIIRQFQSGKELLQAIERKGRVVDVHGTEGIFTYYEQIGELESKLRDKGFFRCHKSYLINLKYVDGYNRQEAILENGEAIVVAKRRYEEFCREVLKVMRENGGIL